MEETLAVPTVPKSDIGEHEPGPVRQPLIGRLFLFVVGLVAVAAIAASAWVYTETQREIVRMSNDIAQIRVSLELYSRQQAPAAAPAGAAAPANDQLLNLSNRLAILEESWRNQAPAPANNAQVPPLPGETAAPGATATGPQTDCMPEGTRFLVSSGDNYPVCGTPAVIDVATVDNSFVTLKDGTIIPPGGNAILKGTLCTVAVMSSGADGMTGYAELRVTC